MNALINPMTFIKRNICLSIIFMISNLAVGQTINNNWKTDLQKDMEEFKNCEQAGGNGNPCAKFMGKSLQTVYKVNDFYSKEKERYLHVDEISQLLKESKEWKMIGHAYEQKALETAQANANANMATVAVYLHQTGVGHMVLVLPGELHPSGSWGFSVPNSSSFFSASPNRSYLNKGLSYAFSKSLMKDVLLYSKQY